MSEPGIDGQEADARQRSAVIDFCLVRGRASVNGERKPVTWAARILRVSGLVSLCVSAIALVGDPVMAASDRPGVLAGQGGTKMTGHCESPQRELLGEKLADLRQPTAVRELAWSPDGTRLAVADTADRQTSLWDVARERLINRIEGDSDASNSIAFSPDGQFLVSALYRGGSHMPWDDRPPTAFGLLDGRTGEFLRRVPPPSAALTTYLPLSAAATDPKGRFVALRLGPMSVPQVLALYDPKTWEPIRFLETPKPDQLPNVPNEQRRFPPFDFWNRMKISPDGKYLALIGRINPDRVRHFDAHTMDWVVVIYGLDPGSERKTITVASRDLDVNVNDIAFSPDSRALATAVSSYTGEDRIKVWDVATGALIRDYPPVKSRGITALDWSPNGGFIAVGAEDKELRLWDAGSSALLQEISLSGWPGAIAFSPDGSKIAYVEHRHVTVRIVNGKQ
jgi:WD40 repeat protein